jgi:MFS family permease
MALASALAPFVALWLKGGDPRLSFTISALTLLVAVMVLLRVVGKEAPVAEDMPPRPASFAALLPLLLALGLAGLGFQLHAFVNASPLYQLHAGKEQLPWLMPLLWLGFFAMLAGVGPLFKRIGALPVATGGILLTAATSYSAGAADNLGMLILLQLICGVGWAMAFAGLMESAATAGLRGSEGLFMGSFFAVTALAVLLRIAFASHWLAAWKSSQFVLPAALLLAAGLIAAAQACFPRGGAGRNRGRGRVSP